MSIFGLHGLLLWLGSVHASRGLALDGRGSPGCGIARNFAGESREFGFRSGGRMRTFRLHLASSYDAHSPTPLLIAYHGAGSDPESFESQTGFSDERAKPDMITVFPAGVSGSWEGPSYAIQGVDDKLFTTNLIAHILGNYCVDESRVYAVGYSNGGGFVGTLACSREYGRYFAALAIVSGAFYSDPNTSDNCNPPRLPLPIMEIHGTDDSTVPYSGGTGRGGPLPSISAWLSLWAKRKHCSASSTKEVADRVLDAEWTCAGTDGSLRHVKVDGHDHNYPNGTLKTQVSSLIHGFLSSHRKP